MRRWGALRHSGPMASHDPAAPTQARDAYERKAYDKSQNAPRGGSITMILVVAAVLIAAAGGLIYVNRDYVEAYVLILLAILDDRRVRAFRGCGRYREICWPRSGQPTAQGGRRQRIRRHPRNRSCRPGLLCERHLPRSHWRNRHERCQADRAGVYRGSGRF